MTSRADRPKVRAPATVGVCAFLLIVAVEHVANPSLDPASHQISEYVHGQIGWLMTLGFVSWSISLAATAALAWSFRSGGPVRAALIAASVGMLLTACFATQTSAGRLPPGVTLSTTGRLHDIGSGITGVALLLAAVLALRIKDEALRRLSRLTVSLLVVVLPAAGVLLAVGSEVGGIRQRLLLIAGCAWQLMFISATGRRREDEMSSPGQLQAPHKG
jgi:hypothetical protein